MFRRLLAYYYIVYCVIARHCIPYRGSWIVGMFSLILCVGCIFTTAVTAWRLSTAVKHEWASVTLTVPYDDTARAYPDGRRTTHNNIILFLHTTKA
jgi:hypothetical protein